MDKHEQPYEFAIDQASIAAGTQLAKQYMAEIFKVKQTRTLSPISEELPLTDVNELLDKFRLQYALLSQNGRINQIPCIDFGGRFVPIDIDQYGGDNSFKRVPFNRRKMLDLYHKNHNRKFLKQLYDSFDETVKLLSTQDLIDHMQAALKQFLAVRHSAFFNLREKATPNSSWLENSPGNSKGTSAVAGYLTVTMTTVSNGLDILSAPSFMGSWSKFGSPSSPVTGYLRPGTYVFAGTGGGLSILKKDPNLINIPPDYTFNSTII